MEGNRQQINKQNREAQNILQDDRIDSYGENRVKKRMEGMSWGGIIKDLKRKTEL